MTKKIFITLGLSLYVIKNRNLVRIKSLPETPSINCKNELESQKKIPFIDTFRHVLASVSLFIPEKVSIILTVRF